MLNKIKTFLLMASVISLASCTEETPLNAKFDTPYGLPPFGNFNYSDFPQAIEIELNNIDQTIKLIAGNRSEATFENTIIPFDRRNERLDVLASILLNLRESDSCDSIETLCEQLLPRLTEAEDDIYMNQKLFARIETVYNNRADLDSSEARVAELYYKDFLRGGAKLSKENQQKLRQYNKELSLLSLKFSQNLLSETNAFELVIDTVIDLAGLPENVIASAAERAKEKGYDGKWLFTTAKADMIPFLQYSDNHDLRKKLYDAYCSRGNNDSINDNKETILKIVSLRAKRAKLLGYKSHAHYVIDENMASTPEIVDSFLMDLWQPALRKAKQELFDMRVYCNWRPIEACDWFYWQERLRKARYDLKESELSEYLVLDNVLEGLFSVANRLYGIKMVKTTKAPLYNPSDNVVYEVHDKDDNYLGIVYFDFFPRETKGAGAWCTTFQEPLDNFDGTRTYPQISIVANLTRPVGNNPALLTFDDVETLFHEFGHALHSLFSNGKYRRTCGNVPRDYVEMPSQFMEHFCREREVLRSYARHYQTGDTIPDRLIDRLNLSSTYGQGFATTEYLAAAILDLHWHMLDADTTITDVNDFEQKILNEIGLIEEIVPRYRTTYFAHSFNFDYSAAYYVYIWSELLDCDAYGAFSGDIFNQDVATRFRQHCLSEAGNSDPMTQYRLFRGQDPSITYLLQQRGLK